MDAITLLRNDHKTVEQLFKRFEKAGDRAYVEKRQIVDRIIEELSVHAAIEEQVFYPVARATVPEHRGHRPREPRGAPHRQVAAVRARRHGPDARALRRQGHRADRERAPPRRGGGERVLPEGARRARPRPRSPISARRWPTRRSRRRPIRTPGRPTRRPATRSSGAIAGVVDRVGDNISGIAQGGVTAVQDLIARILGNDKPKVSPTGSTAARNQRQERPPRRRRPRPTASQQTARSVKSGAAKTAKAAASGAKGTVDLGEEVGSHHGDDRQAGHDDDPPDRAGRQPKRTATTAKRAASKTVAAASGSK